MAKRTTTQPTFLTPDYGSGGEIPGGPRGPTRSSCRASLDQEPRRNRERERRGAQLAGRLTPGRLRQLDDPFSDRSYWELVERDLLPPETAMYIPRLLAATVAGEDGLPEIGVLQAAGYGSDRR